MGSSHSSDRPAADPRDPALFQRVWQRVTAGQEHSPVVPALPRGDSGSPAPQPDVQAPDLLARWIDRLSAALREDQTLARRCSGPAARLLGKQLGLLRQWLRRADTAYFLLTGSRHVPRKGSAALRPRSLADAMRQRWLRQSQWSMQLEADALRAPCPLLRQFYTDVSVCSAASAEEIRHFLEDFASQ